MRKILDRSVAIFAAVALAVCFVKLAPAQQPKPCVLLHNDNVLFGVASQEGEYVVVRRGPDNQIRLPRQQVACWAASLRDLYRYRQDHRRDGDPAAHLRDARWCIRYDLFDLAAEEIRAVFAVDPANETAIRLQRQLQRISVPRPLKTKSTIVPTAAQNFREPDLASQSTAITTVGFDSGQDDLVGVDLAGLQRFAGNVQPMLINRCGRCHAMSTGRAWRLLIPTGKTRPSSRMTRENLAATLRFVDRSSPEQSELYVKAITAHGGAGAPLDPRHAKAAESLKTWLATIGSSPAAESVDFSADGPPPPFASASPENLPTEPTPSLETWLNQRDQSRSHAPARLPQVANPFDPDLFNRRYHPP